MTRKHVQLAFVFSLVALGAHRALLVRAFPLESALAARLLGAVVEWVATTHQKARSAPHQEGTDTAWPS